MDQGNPYADLEESLGELEGLAQYAEDNSSDYAGVSMESMIKSTREPNFLEFGYAHKASIACETLSAGAWAAIVAIAAAVIVALKKFYDWAFGGTSGSSSSGSGSSGGQLTGTIHKIENNKTPLMEYNAKVEALCEELRQAELEYTNSLATEEVSSTTSQLSTAGGRRYISSMEDILALYIKEDADQNPAWQFVMAKRDGFSDDILNNGPYTMMVGDIIKLVESGQFSQTRSKQLYNELEDLMKDAEKTSAEDFKAFNEKLGDYDNVKVSGLGKDYNTVSDLVQGARKEHEALLKKMIDGGAKIKELVSKLERQLEGATVKHISQAAETVKHIVADSETHYNHFKIEADVLAHHESKASREGDGEGASKHHAVSTTMRHMSKFSRNLCELARIMFVYSKALLKIMEHLRNAGQLALRILINNILPKVKNEESKERITNLGRELKTSLAAYMF